MKRIFLVNVAIVLGGCASTWYKPGGTEGAWYQDKYECEQQAASTYPVQMVRPPSAQSYRPVQTNCSAYGNTMSCTSAPTGIDTSMYQTATDINAGRRNGAIESCLYAKGYRRQ